MSHYKLVLPLVAALLMATGCSQQKSSATKALEGVETSLAAIKEDAARYAPEGLKGVESNIARLKTSLENKEYDDVIAGAPQLQKAVSSLESAIESGKEQIRAATAAATTEWDSLSVEVPKMVDTIQARVDELSKKKRLPFGIGKDEFAGAKAGLETMKAQWAEAADEFKSGDKVDAAQKAKMVKGMGEEISEKLKIEKA
jgi:hypothetical protein